jgi:lysyl-tRNA synthetase, class II
VRSAARALSATTLALGVIAAATGWLYVLRPHVGLPGPSVHDALALDELPHRAGVSLLLYVGVWTVAAVLLAVIAREAGADALTSGLLLGCVVGGWLYALNGVSILVVRQIPAHAAFHAAAPQQAVIVPAVLAGVAGAVLGRSHASGATRARTVLAWLVGGVAGLAILDAVLPEHRRSLVTAFDPAHVHGISKALVVPVAAGLLVAARALARGSRRGWEVAAVLLAALLVLNVGRRFDEGAVVTAVAVIALLARRRDFRAPGDPQRRRRVLVHAGTGVLAVVAYGIATLWLNRLMADQAWSPGFALRITARAIAGLSFRGADHLSEPVADWFPLSAFILAWGAVAFVLTEWLAPWRYRLHQAVEDRSLARSLVATWGADTLAPFALRTDKSYFFSDDRSALLAYRVVGGVAIVAGDPIGPERASLDLVRRFLDFAHERGWRVAVLGASERCVAMYRALGLRALYHGDEAVVDVAAFSLEGRAIRKVRQSTHRLAAAGYTAAVLRPSEIDDRLRAQLEEIAREWRGEQPERGFVMALDALFHLSDDDSLFVIGFDATGAPAGFLHFGVSAAGSALSLSSMPRRRGAVNGLTEWLICETVAWSKQNGFARVSLNFAPFAALFTREDLSLPQRVFRGVLHRLKRWFQLDNLLHFNRKFMPEWQPRFVVVERIRDLPRVGVAALAAESYLPFQ